MKGPLKKGPFFIYQFEKLIYGGNLLSGLITK